ncbi:MAG: hypothetical protein IRY94_12650 [Rhodospirillaceae bacterium]|nr:hypothetical protein [Rhodospirillaceae bacterium]
MKMRFALLAGSAALALATGMARQASAFDKVDWDWYANIHEYVNIDVDIDAKFEPDGLVQVEKFQLQVGDVKATSIVTDVEFKVDDGNDGKWDWGHEPKVDPIELPSVVSTATAVGNNQSITADVPVLLHDTQIVHGDYFGGAEISAFSLVAGIENASVDSAATAVGNNISVDMSEATDAAGAGGSFWADSSNALLVADITQIDFADVTATSIVHGISIDGTSLTAPSVDGATAPIVSSVATAVGNNVNITVSVPQP